MKKGMLIILTLVIALSVLGCTEKKADDINALFTEETLADLKEISVLSMGTVLAVSGEELEPVKTILKSLSLTVLEEGMLVEEKVDPVLLIFEYEDGTISTYQISDVIVWPTEVGAEKYCTSDVFFDDLIKAFGVGED